MQDDFDVDALRIDGKLDLTSTTKPSCRRVRTKETFARIPHERGLKLCGRIGAAAWVVLIELDRQIFKNHKNPIHLPNKKLLRPSVCPAAPKRGLYVNFKTRASLSWNNRDTKLPSSHTFGILFHSSRRCL